MRRGKPKGQDAGLLPLMTVKEVTEVLRLSDKAVRNLIYAGQLPAFYLAERRIRVKRSDLETFLATKLHRA